MSDTPNIHKELSQYQEQIECHHSDILLLGVCSTCDSKYPMYIQEYKRKICYRCLTVNAVLSFLCWIDKSHGILSATDDIDVDEAVVWNERDNYRSTEL